jgi:hypothetical protein
VRLRRLHVAGGLIIAAWLASLGWLVQREYLSDSSPGGVAASASVIPGAAFFVVSLNGTQVGIASTTVDTLNGAVRVSERLDVAFPAGGDTLGARYASDLQLSPSLTLRSFTSSVAGDLAPFQMRGLLGAGDSLVLELEPVGRPARSVRSPLAGGTLASAIPLQLVVGGRPRIGRRLRVSVIDPLDGSRDLRTLLVADSVRTVVVDSARMDSATRRWVPAQETEITAWRLEEVGREVPRSMWVDAQGFVVEAESEFGFTLRRTAFEIAHLNFRAGSPQSIADAPLVPRPAAADAVQPADTLAELAVPSSDSAVVATARGLIPGATGEARARALLRAISRRGTVFGDRALRYVALARAAGIPARTVAGARRADGVWRPHLWAEVHLGGWHAVDPATGAWVADTMLVRLRTRGTGHPLALLPLVLRLPPPAPAP